MRFSSGDALLALGNMTYALVIFLLIHHIRVRKSAAGISFKTQLIYALAFAARTLCISPCAIC
jgi:hypothetical protein